MFRYSFQRIGFTALLAALVLAQLSPAPTAAQQPSKPDSAKLGVDKIYTRPGLASPTLGGLEWSPNGKFLSYLRRSGSGPSAKADLYVIDVAKPEMPGRLLVDAGKLSELLPPSRQKDTQATGLGRVTPEQYQWAPGSQALLFVSGDNLYWFDLQAQTGRRLLQPINTPGSDKREKNSAEILAQIKDARISPDGRMVSFVRNHDLWAVAIATGRETRLTFGGSEELLNAELDWVYPEELGIREAYWWSPDSSRIAFLQMDERPVTKYPMLNSLSYTGEIQWMRYPKAGDPNPIVRVGVIDVRGALAPEKSRQNSQASAVHWMDSGSDTNIYLPRVNWLRDSSAVAIQRLNRAQNKLDLILSDASTGQSRVVLTEDDKYWINVGDDLYFFADGQRFLWSSESDHVKGARSANLSGLRYLYLYDMHGTLLQQLTDGDTQVAHVSGVDETQGSVFFVGSGKDVRERHLYRVSLNERALDQITREPGAHSAKVSPTFNSFVDTFSTTELPPQQRLARINGRASGREESAPLVLGGGSTPQLAAAGLRPVEFLTVLASDGTSLQAMMIKPANFDPANKYPVIVSLYGGPHAQLVLNSWGGPTFLFNQLLAQEGYLIFTLDNRGAAGRGHAFETSLYHHFGGVELADQLAGVAWLKSQPFIDPARVGVRGWSYGGFMTCMAMFRATGVFKAGFAGSPVTDWRQYDSIYTERYMGTPQENPEGYKNSSPVNFAGELKGKLLIAAGTGDDNVHFANAVELAEKLINAGRYAELQLYPGRGHGISDQPAQLHLFRHVLEFFLTDLPSTPRDVFPITWLM